MAADTAVTQDNQPRTTHCEQSDSEESVVMMQSADRDDDRSESVAVEDTPAGDDDGSSPDDVIFNTISSQCDANPIPVESQEFPAVSSAHTGTENLEQAVSMRASPSPF